MKIVNGTLVIMLAFLMSCSTSSVDKNHTAQDVPTKRVCEFNMKSIMKPVVCKEVLAE